MNDIFIAILDNDKVVLTETTTAIDVGRVGFANPYPVSIGDRKTLLKSAFTSKEIQSWNNVGGMVDSISKKISLKAT